MALPNVALPRETVDVSGTSVGIRSLSRTEVVHMKTLVGNDEAMDNYILSCGTDTSAEESEAWRKVTGPLTVGIIVDAIIVLSGMGATEDPK